MKPIVRWTIGPTVNAGLEILKYSVEKFDIIYPFFEKIICFNQIEKTKLPKFNCEVEIYEQKTSDISIEIQNYSKSEKHGNTGSAWKLLPPRLNINTHELWLDNDIVLFEKIPLIDEWLKTNYFLGLNGKNRIYGEYDKMIPKNLKICAGLFGLPPNFDFHQEIIEKSKILKEPLGYYNEQGLVANILASKETIFIPQHILKNLEPRDEYNDYPGIHFVGANRKQHKAWVELKMKNLKCM